ncbi:MAG: choice-of-anchor tandem repeat GloVer-containing protein [Verrucomicrobiia bacterium]
MKILRIWVVVVVVVLAGQTFHANAETETVLHSFGLSPTDGENPYAGLVQGNDGNFYGTTQYGGTNGSGWGTVFRVSPSGSYTNLYSFGTFYNDGYTPEAGLVQGSDGNFFGTTLGGGLNVYGTVFQISPSGSYTNLYSFAGPPNDGFNPYAGIVEGSDSNFYGTTAFGGPNAGGTVFRISPGGTYTSLYSFVESPNEGHFPFAGLAQGSDSNFYGTTELGGTTNCDCGTIFKITSAGTLTTLYSFSSGTDGALPEAGLVQGSDDNFYGTTSAGGTYGTGTVFRISPSGSYTNLYSFGSSPNDGANPYAGLVQGSDGNFYGTTQYGGTGTNCDGGCGTVFKLDAGLGPISTNCMYSINPTNAAFDATGGSDSVSVTASNGCAWTAVSNSGFITITSATNGTGNGMVSYSVAANSSSSTLTGTVIVAGQTFTVIEGGASVTYTISTSSSPTTGGSTSGSGSYTNGSAVTVTATPASCYTFANWTVGGTAVSTSTNYSFTASATETVVANFSPISDTITTSSSPTAGGSTSGGGTVNCGSNVTESATANACYQFVNWTVGGTVVSTSPSYGFTASASETVVANFTPINYSITTSASNGGTVSGGGSYACGTNVTVTATPSAGYSFVNWTLTTTNGTVESTSASYMFTASASEALVANFTATSCTYTLSSTNAIFTAAGGSATVTVTANGTNCPWMALNNDTSLITINSGTIGTGDGTVSYTVTANTSSNELTGTMTIAGQTFTVVQAGVGCSFSLDDSTSASYGAAGGSSNVTVTSSNGCPWVAVSNDSFIIITGGANGTGNGTVSYTVTAYSGVPRGGTMTIAGQTYTVYQTGSSLASALTDANQTCKTTTKIDKKTETTNTTTTCTVALDLVVENTGGTNLAKTATPESPKFSVLVWFGQPSTFNPSVGEAPLKKTVSALKEGKSDTIKIKSKKLNGNQASTYIFVTDIDTNVLASVEVPPPE